MKVACLTGNGVSIAYSDALTISSLTEGVVESFSDLADTPAGNALKAFAAQVTGHERDDFEELLGPLDTITQALPMLGGLAAPFQSVAWIADPLSAASEALRRLHRMGVAAALDLIAHRAYNQGGQALNNGAGALVSSLDAICGDDGYTIATLNYDGLIQAALDDTKYSDLAQGWADYDVNLFGATCRCWPLRATAGFHPDRPNRLIHLHGSLGWLKLPDGAFGKMMIDDLRSMDFWKQLKDSDEDIWPLVVLTDRKEPVVSTPPFSIAYEAFRQSLVAMDHWGIAGYSFYDAPVNRLLAEAQIARVQLGLDPPKVVVLGRGDPAAMRADIAQRLGTNVDAFFIDGSGLPTGLTSDAWNDWRNS